MFVWLVTVFFTKKKGVVVSSFSMIDADPKDIARIKGELDKLNKHRKDIMFSHYYSTCSSNELYSIRLS